MQIEILNSNYQHQVNKYLNKFIEDMKDDNEIFLRRNISELTGGEILFLILFFYFVSDLFKSFDQSSTNPIRNNKG